jgi:integrase/recombinase XerC
MRPGEVFALRWENIYLNGTGGLIQVTEGKTKAARRMLPMVPAVHAALQMRWRKAREPEGGWLFPSSSRDGHLNKDTAKDQHKRALEQANTQAKAEVKREIPPFQPYILRHTALTQLAKAGCDGFTLARIAGHSSITITQRYVHPQSGRYRTGILANREYRFAFTSARRAEGQVGTKLGTEAVRSILKFL